MLKIDQSVNWINKTNPFLLSDLVKTKKTMSLTSEEPNADHESSNEHHFFIKEDVKDQRSDEEEEEDTESKDENENKPDLAHANVFAALAALQTGQLTLSQVSYIPSYIIVCWEGALSTISHMNCLHSAFNSIQFPAIADQMSRNKTEIKYTESRWNFQSNVHN